MKELMNVHERVNECTGKSQWKYRKKSMKVQERVNESTWKSYWKYSKKLVKVQSKRVNESTGKYVK